jgi:hypothetical protein
VCVRTKVPTHDGKRAYYPPSSRMLDKKDRARMVGD